MNTNPSWSAIGNSTRSTADTQTPPATQDQPGRGVEDGEGGEAHRRDANESGPAGRPRDERGGGRAEDGDSDVGRGEPLRSVRVEEERVRRDDDEREHHAERERLRGQQAR